MARLRHRIWLLVLIWLVWESPVAGQAPSSARPQPSVQMGASIGFRRYRPGTWGAVAVDVLNPTDQDAELFAVSYIVGEPTLQYGRRIWAPAHSVLRSTCPIRIPDSLPSDTDHVELVSVPIATLPDAEASSQSHATAMARSKPLVITQERPAVGILGDFDRLTPPEDKLPHYTWRETSPASLDDPVFDLVRAACRSQDLSPRVTAINAREVPADRAGLDALDVIVVSTNSLAEDADVSALLRDWTLGGGSLWIMLDQMEQDSVSAILGDAFTSTIVDRVDLTELEIEDMRTNTERQESTLLEFDEAVAFARVLPRDAIVTDAVADWPAAFRQPFGVGRVFFTTLGPSAWFRPAGPDDGAEGKSNGQTDVARGPLMRLAGECLVPRRVAPIELEKVKPLLAKEIGYRILSKEAVCAILAGFCLLLCIAGAVFWRSGRLDRVLWAAPLAAAAASVVFLGVATTARNSVPPCVAVWQSIRLEPGLPTGRTSGLFSVYNPDVGQGEMGATRGGMFLPDMAAMEGRRRRIVWTDEGAWRWSDLELPPGIRTAPLQCINHFQSTVDCRARFGPSGLTGTFGPTPFRDLSDALIAVPQRPVLAARILAGGTLSATSKDVLAPGEFVAATWLSDVQQRRVEVYRMLLKKRVKVERDTRTMLYAWADPLEMGFFFPQSGRLGDALISCPLRFEPSSPGTTVTVPASFLTYRGVDGPDGTRSAAYNSFSDEWADSQLALCQWLRFQVPEPVLPLEVSQATLSLSIRASSRAVDVMALSDGEPVAVRHLSHPIGTYEVILDRPQWLQLDDEGGLKIGIRVGAEEGGESTDMMTQAPWRVEAVQMGVVGKVLGD